MPRYALLLSFIIACAPADEALENALTDAAEQAQATAPQSPPPFGTLTLSGASVVPDGFSLDFTVTGAYPGESVYIVRSPAGPGPGPCPAPLGGQCLSVMTPASLSGSVVADLNGDATFALPVGSLPVGSEPGLQVVALRGLHGTNSLLSNSIGVEVVEAIYGCTEDTAQNYDANATVDDGTCISGSDLVTGFSGDVGPSYAGWSQCGGTMNGTDTSSDFLFLCDGYSEIQFACSSDDDDIAEYVSPTFALTAPLLDDTCDDWAGGAITRYNTGHIISIDVSNPGCGNYDASFDFYMDMVSPQWSCGTIANTHNVGGHMWAYVR